MRWNRFGYNYEINVQINFWKPRKHFIIIITEAFYGKWNDFLSKKLCFIQKTKDWSTHPSKLLTTWWKFILHYNEFMIFTIYLDYMAYVIIQRLQKSAVAWRETKCSYFERNKDSCCLGRRSLSEGRNRKKSLIFDKYNQPLFSISLSEVWQIQQIYKI